MKTRITIYAENDVPVEKLGDNPEKKVRAVWELLLALSNLSSGPQESACVEKVEVWEDK